jgi:hypothetical protein
MMPAPMTAIVLTSAIYSPFSSRSSTAL